MTTTIQALNDLVADKDAVIAQMREAAERLRREFTHYEHGEDCEYNNHVENNEEGDPPPCDCGLARQRELMSEIIGDGEGMDLAVQRVNVARDIRMALRELVRLKDIKEAAAPGSSAEYETKKEAAWEKARHALDSYYNPPAADPAPQRKEPTP